MNKVLHGDCLEVLKTIEDNTVDSIVTDPPYELGFMGKSWDNTGIANNPVMWAECLRVLKPGGYLLSFGGTRTYHRMASAIEDAGFEVRDMIEWIYGSGFPKSLNIGKAVDRLQGNEREVTGYDTNTAPDLRDVGAMSKEATGIDKLSFGQNPRPADRKQIEITKGTSEWEGWGTALKPAHEPICMARKPLAEKTVAENVLKYGTGGINIDESRVAANWKEERPESWFNSGKSKSGNPTYDGNLKSLTESTVGERLNDAGRFPANLIHDNSEEVRECFPESNSGKGKASTYEKFGGQWGKGTQIRNEDYGDKGNASRFFKSIIYQAKASKSERTVQGTITNQHPTIKPIALMEYLIKMVTPTSGTVLDPFAGSGSTLVAAKQNGFNYIGIEMTAEYIPIIEARLSSIEYLQSKENVV